MDQKSKILGSLSATTLLSRAGAVCKPLPRVRSVEVRKGSRPSMNSKSSVSRKRVLPFNLWSNSNEKSNLPAAGQESTSEDESLQQRSLQTDVFPAPEVVQAAEFSDHDDDDSGDIDFVDQHWGIRLDGFAYVSPKAYVDRDCPACARHLKEASQAFLGAWHVSHAASTLHTVGSLWSNTTSATTKAGKDVFRKSGGRDDLVCTCFLIASSTESVMSTQSKSHYLEECAEFSKSSGESSEPSSRKACAPNRADGAAQSQTLPLQCLTLLRLASRSTTAGGQWEGLGSPLGSAIDCSSSSTMPNLNFTLNDFGTTTRQSFSRAPTKSPVSSGSTSRGLSSSGESPSSGSTRPDRKRNPIASSTITHSDSSTVSASFGRMSPGHDSSNGIGIFRRLSSLERISLKKYSANTGDSSTPSIIGFDGNDQQDV